MREINASLRIKKSNHDSRLERRKGLIPGVLYNKNIYNLLFEIGELELNSFVSQNGQHGIVDLKLDGKEHKTLIKEIQRDPVSGKIIHLDLEELESSKKIQAEIPILFYGENNIADNEKIIQKEKNTIKIECISDNIPKYLNLDISKLRHGETLRVRDIEKNENIHIIEDSETVLAIMTSGNTRYIENEEINPLISSNS